MSGNQSPFPGDAKSQGTPTPHQTRPRFAPRLKPVTDTEAQPSMPATNDATNPFKTGGATGNFSGGVNTRSLGSIPETPSPFAQQPFAPAENNQPGTLNSAIGPQYPFAPAENNQPGTLNPTTGPQYSVARPSGLPGAGTPSHGTGTLPSGTGALSPIGQYSGDTGMLTLSHAVKVVRIPVAGKPGEYKTGILPTIPQTATGALPPPAQPTAPHKTSRGRGKLIFLVALIGLVLLGTGGYYFLHMAGSSQTVASTTRSNKSLVQAGNPGATAAAAATATAVVNDSLIVSDPLTFPNRYWAKGENEGINYAFKNGAYHIRQDGSNFGYALIPGVDPTPNSYTYNLTMKLENYDHGNSNDFSFFAMMLNYKGYGPSTATFYIFRVNVANSGGITYEFDKYDNRKTGQNKSPWTQLFPNANNNPGSGQGNGKEFKGGPHAPQAYSVTDINGTFTLSVNGTKIGTVKDTSLAAGSLGMGVNQSKTEASFSNLLLYKR